MRIVFFGLPLAALLLDRDGHDIVLAASPRDEALGLRRARRTFGERFLLRPRADDPALHARVQALRPDLLVSWFWTTLLPRPLLEVAPLGTVGVHPSLLPRHRGPDPYFWAIEAGDAETGVTAHRLEGEYDTGAMLGARRLTIEPSWDAWKLARALDRPSLSLLREVVAAFAAGRPPTEVPQDDALATSAPSPDDELCSLHFDAPTERVLRRVRALSPAPGASFELGDELVTLTAGAPATSFPAGLLPGEAAVVGDRAVVRTADGAVALLAGEQEDENGSLRRLGTEDFVMLVRSATGR